MNVDSVKSVRESRSEEEKMAPRRSWTANIRDLQNYQVSFSREMAFTAPNDLSNTPPCSGDFPRTLHSNAATGIDYSEIQGYLRDRDEEELLKGFVLIKSEYPLDAVAVYSATQEDGEVETFHTERVSAHHRNINHEQ